MCRVKRKTFRDQRSADGCFSECSEVNLYASRCDRDEQKRHLLSDHDQRDAICRFFDRLQKSYDGAVLHEMNLMQDDDFAPTFMSGCGCCDDDVFSLILRDSCTDAVHFHHVDVTTLRHEVADAVGGVVSAGKYLCGECTRRFFCAASFWAYEQISMNRLFGGTL